MGLKEELLGKTVFLDTAPLIYFIEGQKGIYYPFLKEIFKDNSDGKIFFLTSTLSLMEVLVQPFRLNRRDLVENYKTILTTSSTMEILSIDSEIAVLASRLRADYNLKTPDAIQIASSINSGADFFLTNDKELSKVSEIKIRVLANEKL